MSCDNVLLTTKSAWRARKKEVVRGENWINETLVISHSNCWPGKCDSKEGQLVAALRPSLFFCELLQIWLCDPDHHSVYNLTNALVLSFSQLYCTACWSRSLRAVYSLSPHNNQWSNSDRKMLHRSPPCVSKESAEGGRKKYMRVI